MQTDSFAAPADFADYFERYPEHVQGFVARRLPETPRSTRADIEQDLLLHLMSLPEDSILRARGCTDRIQCYEGDRSSAPLFFGYLRMILSRHLQKLMGGRRHVNIDDIAEPICPRKHEHEPALLTSAFTLYIKHVQPELLPVMGAIAREDTYADAQRLLGMAERLFARSRNRLAVLFDCFVERKEPPTWRRVYPERVKVAA